MKVSTDKFRRVHGREPKRGLIGMWAFRFYDGKGVPLVTLFCAHGTFGSACRQARSMARGYACGVETVEVQP